MLGPVGQGLARPDHVVLITPLLDGHGGLSQAAEDCSVEAFVAQLAMKRSPIAILPLTFLFDVECLSAKFFAAQLTLAARPAWRCTEPGRGEYVWWQIDSEVNCGRYATFSDNPNAAKRNCFGCPKKGPAVGYKSSAETDMGDHMPQFRFAMFALLTVAAVSWTAVSALAFSQENLSISGGGSSTFDAPDDQFSNFGRGARPFGSSGPSVQFGAQQGQLAPFGRFQGNGYNAPPPDPYSRPLGNGN